MKIRYLFLLFILLACESKPKWASEEWESFKPDTLNIQQLRINNKPLFTSKDSLLILYGQPDRIIDSAGGFAKQEDFDKGLERQMSYNLYIYPNIRFAVYENKAQVNHIDFRNGDIKVTYPKGLLSNKFDLQQAKEQFPVSYDWRNVAFSRAKHELSPEDLTSLGDEFKWIYLHNGLEGNFNWIIELAFINDKLAFMALDENE